VKTTKKEKSYPTSTIWDCIELGRKGIELLYGSIVKIIRLNLYK
jgi:hypothetical protein